MVFQHILPPHHYRQQDPSLRVLGSSNTLRQWRYRGTGPRYQTFGNRVLYRGDDLNAGLESRIKESTEARQADSIAD